MRFGDVLTLLRASDVTIYTVGFLENQRAGRSARAAAPAQPRSAAESGGEAFFPRSMKQIDEAYDKIVAQIRAQYSLGYRLDQYRPRRPLAQGRDQGPRPRRSRACALQTRKGYFAPYQR